MRRRRTSGLLVVLAALFALAVGIAIVSTLALPRALVAPDGAPASPGAPQPPLLTAPPPVTGEAGALPRLLDAATLAVQVVSAPAGHPVASARALVLSRRPVATRPLSGEEVLLRLGPTGSDGTLTVERSADPRWLLVRAPGHQDAVVELPPGVASGQRVALPRAEARLTGIVVDEAGQAIAGAIVTTVPRGVDAGTLRGDLASEAGAPLAPGHQQAVTSDDGTFGFAVQAARPLQVFATAANYERNLQFAGLEGGPAAASWSGRPEAGPARLVLRSRRVACAHLVDAATGSPIPGGVDEAYLAASVPGQRALRLGSSVLEIAGTRVVPWGPTHRFHPDRGDDPARVVFSIGRREGSVPWPERVTLDLRVGGSRSVLAELPLQPVTQDLEFTKVRMRWGREAPPRRVRIRVGGREDLPEPRPGILLMEEHGRRPLRVMGRRVGTSDLFEFGDLPDEDLHLLVTDTLSQAHVDLLRGRAEGYAVQLPPPCGIVVRLHAEDGQRVYGAMVRAVPDGATRPSLGWMLPPWHTAFAADDRDVPFGLPAGSWTLEVALPGYAPARVPFRVAAGALQPVDVVLEAAGD